MSPASMKSIEKKRETPSATTPRPGHRHKTESANARTEQGKESAGPIEQERLEPGLSSRLPFMPTISADRPSRRSQRPATRRTSRAVQHDRGPLIIRVCSETRFCSLGVEERIPRLVAGRRKRSGRRRSLP
jgi:hypothetical protein